VVAVAHVAAQQPERGVHHLVQERVQALGLLPFLHQAGVEGDLHDAAPSLPGIAHRLPQAATHAGAESKVEVGGQSVAEALEVERQVKLAQLA
jgi:hypothetical protein